MAIAIVLVFVIGWVPYQTTTLLFIYVPEVFNFFVSHFLLYAAITYFLAIKNCAINPIICLTFSRNYR